jgi:hypothetical protein
MDAKPTHRMRILDLADGSKKGLLESRDYVEVIHKISADGLVELSESFTCLCKCSLSVIETSL